MCKWILFVIDGVLMLRWCCDATNPAVKEYEFAGVIGSTSNAAVALGGYMMVHDP